MMGGKESTCVGCSMRHAFPLAVYFHCSTVLVKVMLISRIRNKSKVLYLMFLVICIFLSRLNHLKLLFALFYVPGTEVFYWVHVQLLSICYTDLTEGVNILSLTLLETFNPNYEMTTVMF